jgi:hypothetical protein
MNHFAVITETSIVVIATDAMGARRTVASEARPASLADADSFLAFHSLGRVANWDLGPAGSLEAPLASVDNRFNGTVAARFWEAVGTTHDEFQMLPAREVNNGDLISDPEISAIYVVAGSSIESDNVKIHMVGENQTWIDRATSDFSTYRLVMIARKR